MPATTGPSSEENKQCVSENDSCPEGSEDIQSQVVKRPRSRQWAELFDVLPQALILSSSKGIIRDINPRASDFFQGSKDELLGNHLMGYISLRDQPRVDKALEKLEETGVVQSLDLTLCPPNLPEILARCTCVYYQKEQDSEELILWSLANISENKTKERIIERSESRFQDLLNSIPDGIVMIDEKTRHAVEVNDALCQMVGLTHSDILGKNPSQWGPEDERHLLDNLIDKASQGLQVRSQNLHLRKPNGTLLPIEYSLDRLPSGLIRGFVHDASEKRRADTERQELEKLLRRAQKLEAIGTLAGGVAHDMNNVLASIAGIASAVENELATDDQLRQDIVAILAATRRGRDLTVNLLSFARREKSQQRTFDVVQSTENVERILKRTIPKGVEIQFCLSSDEALITGDPGHIEQALMNLCVNAVDAMGGYGKLKIDLNQTRVKPGDLSVPPGKYVRISVTDTGHGMDPATMKCAFEPFFTTKPRGEGTGLGLAMVYNTIHEHGGQVHLESQSGVGTTVTIFLPLSSERPTLIPSVAEDIASNLDASLKVLVVDDEVLVRRATLRMLQQLGHDVTLASSGHEGIEFYKKAEESFDVVLLDIAMPGMDGTEVLVNLRTFDPNVRVVLLSGFSRRDQAPEMRKLGALGFLQKPFEQHDLKKALIKAIHGKAF